MFQRNSHNPYSLSLRNTAGESEHIVIFLEFCPHPLSAFQTLLLFLLFNPILVTVISMPETLMDSDR